MIALDICKQHIISIASQPLALPTYTQAHPYTGPLEANWKRYGQGVQGCPSVEAKGSKPSAGWRGRAPRKFAGSEAIHSLEKA